MSRFERFPRLFRLPWRSADQIREEVDEEIAFHLEMRTEQLIAEGMDPALARETARREFGDVSEAGDALRSADREVEGKRRRSETLADLALDVRYAVRSLRRARGATLAAVITLGLGIGAVTAVFSLANWIALRPVPGVAEPEQLVLVQLLENGDDDETALSYANFLDLRGGTPALSALAAYGSLGLQTTVDGAAPVLLMGEAVAGDYFGTLGLRSAGGRFFSAQELGSNSPSYLAIISHHLWRTHFGADPGVAGRRIALNGLDYTVIGVAPEGFRGTERLGRVDVWVPVSDYGPLLHQEGWSLRDRASGIFEEFVGRLAPGATPELAQHQLRSAMAGLVGAYPEENAEYAAYLPTVFPGIGLAVGARDRIARTLSLMFGVVAVVLLIAWANVGNLLLLRALRGRGETAVRRALGASRARLLRTYLVEGALLALGGGVVGLLIALGVTGLFRGRSIGWLPAVERVGLDWRVFAFVLVLSLLSGALFGMVPGWAMQREDFLQHLKDASRGATRRATWLRGFLIVVQVSSAMVLLVAALLLGRTLYALDRVEVGFEPEGVLSFAMDPTDLGYDPERSRLFREQLHERVRGIPGIGPMSVTSSAPFTGGYMTFRLHAAGAREAVPVEAMEFSVSPDFFRTLGIPLLAGRGLTDGGPTDEVVISGTLARKLFGEANPLGRQVIGPSFESTPEKYTVMGIVGDARVQDLRAPEPDAVIYRPLSALERWRSMTTLVVRASLPRSETEAAIRAAIAEIEPSLAIWQTQAMSESIARGIAEERVLAQMLMLLASLAGVLAMVGLYAVISYAVAQRTREIGIRMALGARFPAIARLVGREASPLVAGGIGLGLIAAVFGSRLLESRLYGVERLDPLVYAAAALLFAGVAAIALSGPLRAASSVDPTEALRQE